MTTEAFTPTPSQMITDTGPYTVLHGYDEGALVVAVVSAAAHVVLAPSDYTVSPAASDTGGTVTLSEAVVLAYEGEQLEITRRTELEQGFDGQTAREVGLEAQLDWMARAVQDNIRGLAQSVRTSNLPLRVMPPNMAERVLGFDAQSQPVAGPTFDEIANAQGYAIQARSDRDEVGVWHGQVQAWHSNVQSWRNQTLAARDEARAWATLEENTTVEPGLYSAYHWAQVAAREVITDATVYVSAAGNDNDDGRSPQSAVQTIEQAILIAYIMNLPNGVIVVGPGIYYTEGLLKPPPGWGVFTWHRAAQLRPEVGHESANVFLASSGSYFEGFTGVGWQVDDLDNPSGGFLLALAPGELIDRLPYMHKCVQFRPQPIGLVGPPLDYAAGNPDVGTGGGVVLCDGNVPHKMSPFKQIMTWGATPSSPNGVGYCAKNGGFINAVNAVSIWAHRHFMAVSGGQILLSGCSSQFGDDSLYSDGHGRYLAPERASSVTRETAAIPGIEAARASIIDAMWAGLVDEGFTTGWTAENEAQTRRDAEYFITAIVGCLAQGNQAPLDVFVRGLYQVATTSDYWASTLEAIFTPDKLGAFQRSFELMAISMAGLGISASAATTIGNLVTALNATLAAPRLRKSPSLVTAVGHIWTQPRGGVTRQALPARFGGAGSPAAIERSVRERRGGRVIKSGYDDLGNGVFAGGMTLDARTGELGGRPVTTVIRRRAIEAAIAQGGF